MGVRAIEHTRDPRFLVFLVLPFSRATSTRYLATAINYTIVAFCAYHRVPPIYGATIVRYLLPFTFLFSIIFFLFFSIFLRFTMKLFRMFHVLFWSRAVGRWILLDDNAIRLFEILFLYSFQNLFLITLFRKSYESFIYPFNILFSLCILIYSYKISSLPNNIFPDSMIRFA